MPTVREVYEYLDARAPVKLQLDFDNAGFLVGSEAQRVERILVTLDITQEVVEEAASLGAQLIVSHHPVIFHPVKRIVDTEPVGRTLMALLRGNISAICMHTNLDAVKDGVSDELARRLGLERVGQLSQTGVDENGNPYGVGRTGYLPGEGAGMRDFILQVKDALSCHGLRYYDAGAPVRFVAVGGGACSGYLKDAQALGCDTFVTSDVSYDPFLEAKARGINLIDAGHYPTEDVVCTVLVQWLQEAFPKVVTTKTERHGQVIRFL